MVVIERDIHAAPSALRYMLCALVPGLRTAPAAPPLRLRWRGFAVAPAEALAIARLAGADAVAPVSADSNADRLAILWPQVCGFRMLMAVLTHPRWPLPIWRTLQVRNDLRLRRPLRAYERFDLLTGPVVWRAVDKGLEVDLTTRLLPTGADPGDRQAWVWQSVTTFYYRGRRLAKPLSGASGGAPSKAPVVEVSRPAVELGRCDGSGRIAFSRLTGDYNPQHLLDLAARQAGFPAAFAHPHRPAVRALAAVRQAPAWPWRLELWIRGAVLYGSLLSLREAAVGRGTEFALWAGDEPRPVMIGRWVTDETADAPI